MRGDPPSPSRDNHVISPTLRRGKRKKAISKNYQAQLALTKKLDTLSQRLNLFPFRPTHVLEFTRFESYLKRLDLWEFCRIEFDACLRRDLIVQLLASYNAKSRGSYVNEYKIYVSKAALGKALRLPGKKGGDFEEYPDEFISFLVEFVSSWMLLHGDEVWVTPNEVVNWLGLIRGKHVEKVDWAGLVWYMVEKEISQGSGLRNCYYASHLQLLIREQREHLLMGKGGDDCSEVMMVDVEEDQDGEGEVVVRFGPVAGDDGIVENVDGEHDGGSVGEGTQKIGSVESVRCVEFADGNSRSGDSVGDRAENAGECAENAAECGEYAGESAENVDTCTEGADVHTGNGDEHTEYVGEHKENADEHAKNEDDHVNYSDKQFENDENATEMSVDRDLMDLGYSEGDGQGPWLLNGKNDGGRFFFERCSMDTLQDEDNDDGEDKDGEDNEHEHKIMRKSPHGMTRPIGLEHDVSENEQILSRQISEKDSEILQLKLKLDGLQEDIHRRDRELYLMNSVIEGYRRALKQTQKQFTEFRKRHAIPDEPIYKDAGEGGIVKSVMELEKEQIKQEEEKVMRQTIEATYKKHLDDYMLQLEELNIKVDCLECKLNNASKELESLKNHLAKRKSSVNALNESSGH